MYADYSYYTGDFGGSIVPEESWQRAAGAASDWMDAATFGRLTEGIPEEWERQVRRCCCELAESYYSSAILPQLAAADSSTGQLISAETNSTYSVTYRSASEQAASLLHGSDAGLEDVLHSIAMKHLGRTGLLFRGVD